MHDIDLLRDFFCDFEMFQKCDFGANTSCFDEDTSQCIPKFMRGACGIAAARMLCLSKSPA